MNSGKGYNDLNTYLRNRFGTKVYKLALSGGMTCPNRDGTCGDRGCIFCSEGGSGDFAAPVAMSVKEQIEWAKERLREKLANEYDTAKYIAYFQSFTNTYAPTEYLRKIFTEAINDDSVVALSVGTRPDCLGDEVIELLASLNREKPVFVELGLQTIHEQSARFIRRGYELEVFDDAMHRLQAAEIEVVVHVILGLPGETEDMMIDTVRYVGEYSKTGRIGIKLQLLHVLKGTDLGDMYEKSPERFGRGGDLKLHMEETSNYVEILLKAIGILPADVVIHRLTGDAPHDKLLFPMWSANKRTTLNSLAKQMRERSWQQGCLLDK